MQPCQRTTPSPLRVDAGHPDLVARETGRVVMGEAARAVDVRQRAVTRAARRAGAPRRVASTAYSVGELTPSIACRSAPSEIACETWSGRRARAPGRSGLRGCARSARRGVRGARAAPRPAARRAQARGPSSSTLATNPHSARAIAEPVEPPGEHAERLVAGEKPRHQHDRPPVAAVQARTAQEHGVDDQRRRARAASGSRRAASPPPPAASEAGHARGRSEPGGLRRSALWPRLPSVVRGGHNRPPSVAQPPRRNRATSFPAGRGLREPLVRVGGVVVGDPVARVRLSGRAAG